jgi:3-hydroxybutyrate dehydrogenase
MVMLKGKVALVTGSTSGIGLGIAHAFAAAGADLVLNGMGDAATIDRLVADIAGRHGVRVIYNPADMTQPTQITAMVAAAAQELGRIDIVVNNAGIQFVSPVKDFPDDRWNAVIAINLTAPFQVTRAVLPQMLARNWGRIINIASVHGLVASADKSAYVASKHGLIGLTKTVALETARTGVTCNAICPGWVLTPLVQAQIDALAARDGLSADDARIRLLSEKQPSQAFATPQDLGALAVFLASESAGNIRGAAMTVDGAWTAQ